MVFPESQEIKSKYRTKHPLGIQYTVYLSQTVIQNYKSETQI